MSELRKYFMQHVRLAFKSYRNGLEDGIFGFNIDTDAKRAIDFATSLYHTCDYMPTKDFDRWYRECPYLFLIQNIANIYKHNGLDANRPQYKKRLPLVTTPDSVWQTLVFTIYKDEQGKYTIAHKEVIVTLDDKSERELTPVLYKVYNFWIDKLKELNIDTTTHVTAPDRNKVQSRESRGKAGDFKLRMERGEDIKRRLLVKKYDYKLGEPVPFDFEAEGINKVTASVRKPPSVVVDWTLTDKKGRVHKIEVPLTQEQLEQYNNLDSQSRFTYLMILAEKSQVGQDLIEKLKREESS